MTSGYTNILKKAWTFYIAAAVLMWQDEEANTECAYVSVQVTMKLLVLLTISGLKAPRQTSDVSSFRL